MTGTWQSSVRYFWKPLRLASRRRGSVLLADEFFGGIEDVIPAFL